MACDLIYLLTSQWLRLWVVRGATEKDEEEYFFQFLFFVWCEFVIFFPVPKYKVRAFIPLAPPPHT